MQHNLNDQIEWLTKNFTESHLAGFQYAPTASKNIEKPEKFNFDNQKRLTIRNVALSSVGNYGHMELQKFRKNDIVHSPIPEKPDPPNYMNSPLSFPTSNRPPNGPSYPSSSNKAQSNQPSNSVVVGQDYSIPDSAFLEFDLDGKKTYLTSFS